MKSLRVLVLVLVTMVVSVVPLGVSAWPTSCQGACIAWQNANTWHTICLMYSEPGQTCAASAANLAAATANVDAMCNIEQ